MSLPHEPAPPTPPATAPLPASADMYLQQHAGLKREHSASAIRFHIDAEDSAPPVLGETDGSDHSVAEVRVDVPGEEVAHEVPSLKSAPSMSQSRTLRSQSSFLAVEDNVRTVLVWQDLTVSAPIRNSENRKVLLNNVSGAMTGGLWAIMGPSGCGQQTAPTYLHATHGDGVCVRSAC